MKRAVLVFMCVLALVTGEAGVLLKHLPVGYVLGVAAVCGVLGCVSWWRGGAVSQSSGDSHLEQFIEEMKGLCPWMRRDDVLLLRRAFAYLHVSPGEDKDMCLVADAALQLHVRAQAVGDEQRAWAFWQMYSEVCAWQQGQHYCWPALPQELEERGFLHLLRQ